LGVEREFRPSVHGSHERPAIAIERDNHPRRWVRNDFVEVGRAQIDRVHSTAKEVTDNALFAGIGITERLADSAASAVGAYQVGRLD